MTLSTPLSALLDGETTVSHINGSGHHLLTDWNSCLDHRLSRGYGPMSGRKTCKTRTTNAKSGATSP